MARWGKALIWPAEKHPLGAVPRLPGLYAVHLYGHGVVYVGKSDVDINGRVAQRVRPCEDGLWTCGKGVAVPVYHIWVSFSVRWSGIENAERRIIRRINPVFNVVHRLPGHSMWEQCTIRFRAEQARARLVCVDGGQLAAEAAC